MKGEIFKIKVKVWLWPGENPWHFITLEEKYASDIKKEYIWPRRGFGAIPVNVTLGKTSWKTSIFPDKKGTYVLPLKKEVRVKEGIKVGDNIRISLEVIV